MLLVPSYSPMTRLHVRTKMIVRYNTCDHCGKQLDAMHDYIDYDINNFTEVDLCADCLRELETIIKNFLHRENVTL